MATPHPALPACVLQHVSEDCPYSLIAYDSALRRGVAWPDGAAIALPTIAFKIASEVHRFRCFIVLDLSSFGA